MSREIKFRAYVKGIDQLDENEIPHKGNFIYGNLVRGDGYDFITSGRHMFSVGYTNFEWQWTIKKGSAEQFTGLKDANGKEIYEGDIVKFSDDLAIVKFGEFGVPDARTEEYVDKALGFYFDPKVSLSDIEPFSMTIPVNELYACCTGVIGNVHTNPELLEAQHDTRTD